MDQKEYAKEILNKEDEGYFERLLISELILDVAKTAVEPHMIEPIVSKIVTMWLTDLNDKLGDHEYVIISMNYLPHSSKTLRRELTYFKCNGRTYNMMRPLRLTLDRIVQDMPHRMPIYMDIRLDRGIRKVSRRKVHVEVQD